MSNQPETKNLKPETRVSIIGGAGYVGG